MAGRNSSLTPNARARARAVSFPHAGGTASLFSIRAAAFFRGMIGERFFFSLLDSTKINTGRQMYSFDEPSFESVNVSPLDAVDRSHFFFKKDDETLISSLALALKRKGRIERNGKHFLPGKIVPTVSRAACNDRVYVCVHFSLRTSSTSTRRVSPY